MRWIAAIAVALAAQSAAAAAGSENVHTVLAQARSDAVPGDAPAPPKPAADEKPAAEGVPPVEPVPAQPVDAPTLRKAETDKHPCVIKPVMTDADLIRCGATPPKYQ